MNSSPGEVVSDQPRDVEALALELSELSPKSVSSCTADNIDQIVEDYLNGDRSSPSTATYSKLDEMDFDGKTTKYREFLDEIYSHPDIPEQQHHVYKSYIDRSIDTVDMMRQTRLYRQADNEADRAQAKTAFMELNKKLYGEPEVQVAQAMVAEVLSDSAEISNPELLRIRDDFIKLLPNQLTESTGQTIKLEPSQQARDSVEIIVDTLYSPLLKHVDDAIERLTLEREVEESELKFGPKDIADVFQTIIDSEFPDSGWKVDIRKANNILVQAATKTVIIPEKRALATVAKVKGLVVHELGVHMLKSIIGEKSNLIPLRFGLSGGGDAEEGIAKVMESAVAEDVSRTGYQHYLNATLVNQDYDLDSAFEVMWRYKVIDACLDKPQSEVNEKFINDQKIVALKIVLRSLRGTGALPWHSSLSYYKGTSKIWNYIEEHVGDPDYIALMFLGRIDPTDPQHIRGGLDAKNTPEPIGIPN